MTTVYLMLDTRRANQNGEFPIKISICHNRQTAYRNTNVYCRENHWDKQRQVLKSNFPNAVILNQQLKELIAPHQQYVATLNPRAYAVATMTATDIFNAVEQEQKQQEQERKEGYAADTFMYMLHEQIRNCVKDKTAETYRYTEKKLQQYLLSLPPTMRDIDFQTIDFRFLSEFDRWMQKEGIGANSRGIVFRNIRVIWNRAIDYEVVSIDKYPFRKFKVPSAKKEKEYLPLDGFRKLLSLDLRELQGVDTLERTRDFFLLSFFLCGINPVDLFYAKNPHSLSFAYIRRKIEHHNPAPIRLKIPQEAQQIIDKYAGDDTLLNFINHYVDYDSFYYHIKKRLNRLAVMIGYPQLTLYWARYSWATYAAQLDVPINVIGKALGHADATLAEERYISFDWNKVDIANRRVIDYVMEGVVPNSIPAPKYVEKVSKKS